MILGLSIFNFYTLLVGSIPPFVQAAYFGCITIGLVMLFYSGGSEKQPNILEIILALLCFSAAIYITLRMDVWESRWPLADPLNSYELIIGAILIVIAFEASRRAVGIVVAGIGGLALMYTVFGHLIPGQFSHRPYELIEIIDQIVYTTNGIFSPAMIVIAKYVFVLVSIGVFLEKTNGGELFSIIGYA